MTDHTGLNPLEDVMSREFNGIGIEGGTRSQRNCVRRILGAIAGTSTGGKLFAKISARSQTGRARIVLNIAQIAQVLHGGKLIALSASKEIAHKMTSGNPNPFMVPIGPNKVWTKASLLRILAHELSHLAECPGGQCQANAPCSDEEDAMAKTKAILEELNSGLGERNGYPTTAEHLKDANTHAYQNAPAEAAPPGLDCW